MEENIYIKEKNLENHPNKLNIEQLKISVEQMENCICRIKCLKEGHGTGFFLVIPVLDEWNLSLRVLMTNFHVLEKNEIMGKTIDISINDGKYDYKIKIDDSRKIYSNEKYDVTIIEIKKEDGIKKNSFLEIDNQIFEKNSYEKYIRQPIYLLHYPKGIEVEKSDGILGNIDENYEQIQHFCSSSPGSSGGPIINLKNQKVIGIHKGAARQGKDYNYGTYLKLPIEEFNKIFNSKEKDNKDNNNKKIDNFKNNDKNNEGNNKNKNIKNDVIKENINNEVSKINLNNISNDIIKDENIINNINCICRIEMEVNIKDKLKYITGMCLLCNISSKNMKVLITYNHIINIDILNNEKKLVYINNNNESKEINMKKNRYKYTNEELDITIIEIFEDEENKNNFIEIDKYINSRDYKDEEIYLIEYNKRKIKYINDKIKEKKNEYYICNKNNCFEGIIILKENLKLIGIIKNNENNTEYVSINILINKINYIKSIYEIKKEDIGKEIQIINNMNFWKDKNEEIEEKIKVIINGEILKILKYQFNEEGLYTIYIMSDKLLTNMSYMFFECSRLKELNLSHLKLKK